MSHSQTTTFIVKETACFLHPRQLSRARRQSAPVPSPRQRPRCISFPLLFQNVLHERDHSFFRSIYVVPVSVTFPIVLLSEHTSYHPFAWSLGHQGSVGGLRCMATMNKDPTQTRTPVFARLWAWRACSAVIATARLLSKVTASCWVPTQNLKLSWLHPLSRHWYCQFTFISNKCNFKFAFHCWLLTYMRAAWRCPATEPFSA